MLTACCSVSCSCARAHRCRDGQGAARLPQGARQGGRISALHLCCRSPPPSYWSLHKLTPLLSSQTSIARRTKASGSTSSLRTSKRLVPRFGLPSLSLHHRRHWPGFPLVSLFGFPARPGWTPSYNAIRLLPPSARLFHEPSRPLPIWRAGTICSEIDVSDCTNRSIESVFCEERGKGQDSRKM